jgi:hypothetical protein
MILIRNLAFIQIHKTGSTAAEQLLLSHPDAIKFTKHSPASIFMKNKFVFFAACRDPLEYYRSLFFYSCMADKNGGLRGALTLPLYSRFIHLGWRRNPRSAFSMFLHSLNREHSDWPDILSSPACPLAFHEFVSRICSADSIRFVPEGLMNSSLLGFYTNRHLRMCCDAASKRINLNNANAREFYAKYSIIDYLLPVENLIASLMCIYKYHGIDLRGDAQVVANVSMAGFDVLQTSDATRRMVEECDGLMASLHQSALRRFGSSSKDIDLP